MEVKGESIICWHCVAQEGSWSCSQGCLEMMMVATRCRQNIHCVSTMLSWNVIMASPANTLVCWIVRSYSTLNKYHRNIACFFCLSVACLHWSSRQSAISANEWKAKKKKPNSSILQFKHYSPRHNSTQLSSDHFPQQQSTTLMLVGLSWSH